MGAIRVMIALTTIPESYKEGNVNNGRSYVYTLTCEIYGIPTTSNEKGTLSYSPDQMGEIVDPLYLASIVFM